MRSSLVLSGGISTRCAVENLAAFAMTIRLVADRRSRHQAPIHVIAGFRLFHIKSAQLTLFIRALAFRFAHLL
jgi:hypothetical protein